jgi:integrase
MPPLPLAEIVARYVENHPYGISPGHVDNLRYSVNLFGRLVNSQPPTVSQFTPDVFNRYVDKLAATHARATAKSQRGNLLTLWHFAYDVGMTEVPPLRIRKLRPLHHCPEAWDQLEIRRLMTTADAWPGVFRLTRQPRALFWGSLIRVAYDTALRLGDLLALTWADLEHGRIVQHKTGRVVVFRTRESTRDHLRGLVRTCPTCLVWPWHARRDWFYAAFKEIVTAAEIRPGTFRWIRRTAVTQLERVAPGAGTRLAGHAHRSTTEDFYIDSGQLDPVPLPPLEVVS